MLLIQDSVNLYIILLYHLNANYLLKTKSIFFNSNRSNSSEVFDFKFKEILGAKEQSIHQFIILKNPLMILMISSISEDRLRLSMLYLDLILGSLGSLLFLFL